MEFELIINRYYLYIDNDGKKCIGILRAIDYTDDVKFLSYGHECRMLNVKTMCIDYIFESDIIYMYNKEDIFIYENDKYYIVNKSYNNTDNYEELELLHLETLKIFYIINK